MLWISIDRTLEASLSRQIYDQIRSKILSGELVGGDHLPATRELAAHLGLSRNVVMEAFDQLAAEGFIVGRQGSGSYVAEGALLGLDVNQQPLTFRELHQTVEADNEVVDFRSGIPALDLFPRALWGQTVKQVCLEMSQSIFGYDQPEGRAELRQILAQYLRRSRGVICHPDQLVITSGATQAFSLLADLLLTSGDEVIMEDPITHEIQTIFTSRGASLCPVPVDDQGIQTDQLPSGKKPRFIFVTPSHQFPLGSTLPIQRRIQLIQFARTTECYIVEDDYDSEFRHIGAPIHSLQGLDPERVIYVGTFSKNLSPALRLGYLILPPALTKRCKELKWYTDLHSPSLEQLALARFIDDGLLERHIRKMKKVYKKRRAHLKSCLIRAFGEEVKIIGDSTGMHLIAEFEGRVFSPEVVERFSREYNVRVYPVELHTIQKKVHQDKLILGYGNVTTEEISSGVLQLKDAIFGMGGICE